MPLSRALCISIHDVAPATWPACAELLRLVDALGPAPVTLLVVPDFHHRGRIDRFPDFIRAVESRLARGDEVALHGYYHLDEVPPPASPTDWFARRVLTRGEGEFYRLKLQDGLARLERGRLLFEQLGWPVQGFVPPAWLLGKAARQALNNFDFSYTTTRTGLYRLPRWSFVWSPSLVYSVGSLWRHAMSETLNTLIRHSCPEVLRVSMHPADVRCERALAHWEGVLTALLPHCTALTKAAFMSQTRPA